MANYSIALGTQPPQIDPSNALAFAAQIQRQKAAEQQAQQAMELDRQRFGLQQKRFGMEQQQFQAGQSAAQAKQNALAEYTKAQQSGDENALSRLSAYPELQSRVLQVRNQMAEAERGEFDQKLIRNARRAQQVMGVQGEAKQQAWQGALQDALQSGDITPEMYEQYATLQPNDLMLQNIVEQAVPVQNLYQAPTAKMQELEAAGIEQGTPEYQAQIAPTPLPKFEKVGNRLIRINPDGTTADLTPPLPQGAVTEDPPKNYRWQIDPGTGQPAIDESGRPIAEPVPGGPATKLPAADAAKIAALQTAEKSFEDAKTFYENSDFTDRGNQMLNRGEAGRAERTVRLAVESALRAMTGAAAPESEVESYMNLFGPSAWDTPTTARDKLDRLQDFLANLRANIEQGRGPALGAQTPARGTAQTATGNNDPLGILD